jgi:hypothetical protein
VGEWKQGMKNGLGTYYYDDDYVFEGRWRHDKKLEGNVTYLNKRFKQVFFTQTDLEARADEDDGNDHYR